MDELHAHEVNGTWEIVFKPQGQRTINGKWDFKVQTNRIEGKVIRKARLCARVFKQIQGIDFQETFAPVVRYDTVRFMLTIAVQLD